MGQEGRGYRGGLQVSTVSEEAMVSCEGSTPEEVEQSLGAIIQILWSGPTQGVNTGGYRLFKELTITTNSGPSCSSADFLEKLSRRLCVIHCPKLLESIESAQRFGSGLFKPVLPIPNPGLAIHRVG